MNAGNQAVVKSASTETRKGSISESWNSDEGHVKKYSITFPITQGADIMDAINLMRHKVKASPVVLDLGHLTIHAVMWGNYDDIQISLTGHMSNRDETTKKAIVSLVTSVGALMDERYPLKEAVRG